MGELATGPGTLLARGRRGTDRNRNRRRRGAVRVRTREKLQLLAVVGAGIATGILLGWILVQFLILR